jgi:hypothetical protein
MTLTFETQKAFMLRRHFILSKLRRPTEIYTAVKAKSLIKISKISRNFDVSLLMKEIKPIEAAAIHIYI